MDDTKVQQEFKPCKQENIFCFTCLVHFLPMKQMDQRKVQQESSHAKTETFLFFSFFFFFDILIPKNFFVPGSKIFFIFFLIPKYFLFFSWFQNIYFFCS